MEYKILESDCPEGLEAQVNRFIYDGWKPLGWVSVCVVYDGHEAFYTYAQAMIRE